VGCSKRSVLRWSRDEAFAAAVKVAREEALAAVQHGMELGAAEAVACLRLLVKISPKKLAKLGATVRVRLDAAKALAALLPEPAEAEEARLAEIEKQLGIRVIKVTR